MTILFNPIGPPFDFSTQGGASGPVDTITGNDGVVLNPVGNNINIYGSGVLASGISAAGNIYTTGSGATLTINETQAQFITNLTHISFANSPYTVLPTDYFIVVDTSGGAITINLPPAAGNTNGRMFVVKDSTGDAEANNVTVNGGAGTTIEFNAVGENILNNNFESFAITYDLSNTNYVLY